MKMWLRGTHVLGFTLWGLSLSGMEPETAQDLLSKRELFRKKHNLTIQIPPNPLASRQVVRECNEHEKVSDGVFSRVAPQPTTTQQKKRSLSLPIPSSVWRPPTMHKPPHPVYHRPHQVSTGTKPPPSKRSVHSYNHSLNLLCALLKMTGEKIATLTMATKLMPCEEETLRSAQKMRMGCLKFFSKATVEPKNVGQKDTLLKKCITDLQQCDTTLNPLVMHHLSKSISHGTPSMPFEIQRRDVPRQFRPVEKPVSPSLPPLIGDNF